MRRMVLWLILALVSCEAKKDRISEYFEDGKWDQVLECYSGVRDSLRIIDICRINIALASKGELADRAFNYFQFKSQGLFPEWNRLLEEGEMLAEIYYLAGYVALAQRMAFEADVCEVGQHQNEMLKILVKTNIIFGTYKVAEKYICFLEDQGGKYAEWASAQRRFLYNDAAVDADSEYGEKRSCIPEDNFQCLDRGIDEELKDIIRANPKHRNTIEILGTAYLLDCDFPSFRSLLDEFYGTEALPVLPKSFQEAACFLSQIENGYWKKVGVAKAVHKSYIDFVDRLGKRKSMEKFRGTYWYYVMRMNS